MKGYNARMKKYLALVAVALETYCIVQTLFSNPGARLWMEAAASMEIPKPFVYRVLVPLVSQLIHTTGLALADSVIVTMAASMVFFYLASVYLYQSLSYKKPELYAFIACQVLIFLTIPWLKPYDYASAAFFALMLGLLKNNKHGVFLAVFPLATLNRETTFLLIPFYVIYFWDKFPRSRLYINTSLIAVMSVLITILLREVFAERDGSSLVFNAGLVFSTYVKYWYASVPMFVFMAYIVQRSFRREAFTRKAIFVILPLQIVLHILLGMPFEVRVFAELVSILARTDT